MIEDVRELQLLEEIYGPISHLHAADFIDAISMRSLWIFNPAEIRQKLYKAANVKD